MTGDVPLIYNNAELQENINSHFIQALLFPQQYKSEKKLSYFLKHLNQRGEIKAAKGGKQ